MAELSKNIRRRLAGATTNLRQNAPNQDWRPCDTQRTASCLSLAKPRLISESALVGWRLGVDRTGLRGIKRSTLLSPPRRSSQIDAKYSKPILVSPRIAFSI